MHVASRYGTTPSALDDSPHIRGIILCARRGRISQINFWRIRKSRNRISAVSRPPDLRSERIKDHTDPNSPPEDYPHIWGIVLGARRGRISQIDFRRIQKSRNRISAMSRPPDLRSERIKDRTDPNSPPHDYPHIWGIVSGARRGRISRNDFRRI